MEFNFENLMERVSELLKSELKTETVIGEAFTFGDFTVVPVMKFGMGLGSGGGSGDDQKKGKGSGGGAGAGIGVEPMGFLVTRGEEISFIPAKANKGLGQIFDKVPDIMEKYMNKKKDKEKEES